jgi:YD repeat-containing protein
MDQYVQQAAEFSSRARANVYFPNPQSIFNGVQFAFVNVGTGNLTFVRRDLVASGRIPIIVARVYDSSSDASTEFGLGWRLSAAETISPLENKVRLTTESGSVVDFVTSDRKTFQLEKDYPSDYSSLIKTAPDTFQASLRTGFQQEFKLIGDVFRLTKVTDRHGNELRLIYKKSELSKIANANHWIEFSRDERGRLVLARDDQQRKISYLYDHKGRLIETDDLGGHAWKYEYTDGGKLKSATDPLQRVNFGVAFDGSGRVQRLQLASGTIQYNYDPRTSLTTVIDRKKLASRFFQNEEGITTRVVNALAGC